MKYKYSIIIPVYNSEKYIINALKSVLDQKGSIEIIIIDDGSYDSTEKIVSNFIEHYKLHNIISYYKIPHQGVAVARNVGISKCRGDYLLFLDSDDEFFPNTLLAIDNYLKLHPVDLLKCVVKCFDKKKYDGRFDTVFFDSVTGLEALLNYCKSEKIFATPWSYIISVKFFRKTNLVFLENTVHEDYGLIPLLIYNAPLVSSINIPLYKYIKRKNSTITNNDKLLEINRMNDFLLHTYNLIDTFFEYDISEKNKLIIIDYFYNRMCIKYSHLNKDIKKLINEELIYIINEIVKTNNNLISKNINSIFQRYNYIDFPLEYKITIKAACQLAVNVFKKNLISIILGGSGGKNEIVDQCSDLDFYIILNNYAIKEIVSFTKKCDRFRIHIGITAYSQEELRLGWIDGKTKVMFYEKNNYHVNPTLYGEDIQKMINYSEVRQNDQRNLPNILHECRRMRIDVINGKVEINKKYIKKLLVLIKCFLNVKNIFSYGYKRVLCDFKTYIKRIDKNSIILTNIADFDIISAVKNPLEMKKESLSFGQNILEYISEQLKEDKDE